MVGTMKYSIAEISDLRWFNSSKVNLILKNKIKNIVVEIGRCPLATEYGNWTYIVFGDYINGVEHDVLVYGDFKKGDNPKANILMRMHSSCRTSDIFHASNCECRQELEKAMSEISKEKSGIILYLNQEGAGNGLFGKINAYNKMFEWKNGRVVMRINKKTGMPVDVHEAYTFLGMDPDARDYSIAGRILKKMNVNSVRLMTNNPAKINGLEALGIRVMRKGIHIKPENKMVKHLLRTKAEKLGHNIEKKHIKMK